MTIEKWMISQCEYCVRATAYRIYKLQNYNHILIQIESISTESAQINARKSDKVNCEMRKKNHNRTNKNLRIKFKLKNFELRIQK